MAEKKKKEQNKDTTAVATRDKQELAPLRIPTVQEVMKWLCPGVDEKTAVLFVKTAQVYGLSPWKRELYLVPFKGQYSIVIGYQVFIQRARRDPNYQYFETGLLRDGDKKVTGAWCKIHRKDWDKPFYHEILAEEYKKDYSVWKDKPITMLKKTAIAQAHRLVYPDELAGLPQVDFRIVDEEGKPEEVEAKIINSKPLGKVDEDFFGEPSAKKEETKPKKETSSKAFPEQIRALEKIFDHPSLPQQLSTELVDILDKHESGEVVLNKLEASKLISKYQRAIIDAKEKVEAEQPAPEH